MNKKLILSTALIFMLGCGGGGSGSSSSNGGNETDVTYTSVSNTALGPVENAKVEIYTLKNKKIYETTTNALSGDDVENGKLVDYNNLKVGKFTFTIKKSQEQSYGLNDNTLLLIKVTSGKDVDIDDDGVVDDTYTDVKGTLYAYVYYKDLKAGNITINAFTTLAVDYLNKEGIKDSTRIVDTLNKFSKYIFKTEGMSSFYKFNPAKHDENGDIEDLSKLKDGNTFYDLINSQEFKDAVYNNDMQNLFKDDDGDGLPNIVEKLIGSDPNNPNTDGDGVGDYGEFMAGLDLSSDDISAHEDILYQYQWHLKNTGQRAGADNPGVAGFDINITEVWKKNTGDKTITVAVVDTGIEKKHPDLNSQVDYTKSYRYSDGSNDPSPDSSQLINDPYGSAHGTCVAGIIAAKSWNNIGVKGIAPSTTLIGLNVFSNPTNDSFYNALSKEVNVSSNSWGVSSGVIYQDSTLDDIFESGSESGTIFVFAAGNDRYAYKQINGEKYYYGNANNSDLLNNKYTIVVAAMDANGSYSSYSNFGDDVLVTAPAGEFGYYYPAIVTTDLTGLDYGFDSNGFADDYRNGRRFDVEGNENGDYTSYMNGTSAATPMVSGVVALMLKANPHLTYREVKYILATTARKVDENHPDWEQNAAGLWFNPSYGFGLVDVGAAIEKAKNFALPEEKETALYSANLDIQIPDNDSNGVSVNIDVDENITIEYVNLWVNIPDHQFVGDLEIDLVSPSGTVSKLSYGGKYYVSGTLNYKRYGSNKFLNESSKGTWKVIVKDLNPDNTGTLKNVSLKIFGH